MLFSAYSSLWDYNVSYRQTRAHDAVHSLFSQLWIPRLFQVVKRGTQPASCQIKIASTFDENFQQFQTGCDTRHIAYLIYSTRAAKGTPLQCGSRSIGQGIKEFIGETCDPDCRVIDLPYSIQLYLTGEALVGGNT